MLQLGGSAHRHQQNVMRLIQGKIRKSVGFWTYHCKCKETHGVSSHWGYPKNELVWLTMTSMWWSQGLSHGLHNCRWIPHSEKAWEQYVNSASQRELSYQSCWFYTKNNSTTFWSWILLVACFSPSLVTWVQWLVCEGPQIGHVFSAS